MKRFLFKILHSFFNSDALTSGGLAIIVGFSTGVGVWVFKYIFEIISKTLFTNISGWPVIFIPVIGGLLVGFASRYISGEEKFHGTADVIQAVALSGGRLRYQNTLVKTLGAIISIGSGASVGPEDPSVQIGANLGSWIGQKLRLSDDRIRTLVAAGAASAIAAAFNAPITGVFFAIEIILGEIGSSTMSILLVASVTSSVFTQAMAGSSPAFQVPSYALNSAWELPLYLLLGLLAGPISALYIDLVYWFQDLFKRWQVPAYVKPATAGLAVGISGLIFPQIFGVGYDVIGNVLNSTDYALWLLIALLVLKVVLTPVCIGSGFIGGVFAPSLYVGAMLGGGLGIIAEMLFPSFGINSSAFALVGMAAVLAGTVHAPLTAILLLFEMTNDYRIILPLMFAVAVSLVVSETIQRDSVYHKGLSRFGIRLERGRDVEVLSALTVSEVMRSCPETLMESQSLTEATEVFNRTHQHGIPITDSINRLIGVLTLKDIENASGTTVGEACSRNLELAFPDESLNMTLRRMSRRDIGMLPVVNKDAQQEIIGILERADIIHAYNIALSRRMSQRHKENSIRLEALTPMQVSVMDVAVEKNSIISGKSVMKIPFPRDCIIASIRRGGQVFIPRGDTVIMEGDVLVVATKKGLQSSVLQLCKSPEIDKITSDEKPNEE